MKFASMKMPAKERKDAADCSAMPTMDGPLYPWGLEITLSNDVLEKLALDELPDAGARIVLVAKASVTNARVEDTAGGKTRSLSLQITDLALDDPDKYESSDADVLFKKKG